MQLRLRNRYPFPFVGLSKEQTEAANDDAQNWHMVIDGVVNFEWIHVPLIEFRNEETLQVAQELTGWKKWKTAEERPVWVLEVPLNRDEGYDTHPAIIVHDHAWCGFQFLAGANQVLRPTLPEHHGGTRIA
jgi:hypothetical protein